MSRGLLPFGLLALAVAWSRNAAAEPGEQSEREDYAPTENPPVSKLAEALGVPYAWGAGSPSTPWPHGEQGWDDELGRTGEKGWDCSGFAQAALVRLGILSSSEPDRTAQGLHDIADQVDELDVREGDLAFYGSSPSSVVHVMVVTGPRADGWTPVIGASGGGSSTFGDDPDAYVKAFDDAAYRGDLLGFGRV